MRSNGAVPATIGMISGRMKIGLERSELQRLATRGVEGKAYKLSRRDVGSAMVKGVDGGGYPFVSIFSPDCCVCCITCRVDRQLRIPLIFQLFLKSSMR